MEQFKKYVEAYVGWLFKDKAYKKIDIHKTNHLYTITCTKVIEGRELDEDDYLYWHQYDKSEDDGVAYNSDYLLESEFESIANNFPKIDDFDEEDEFVLLPTESYEDCYIIENEEYVPVFNYRYTPATYWEPAELDYDLGEVTIELNFYFQRNCIITY